MTEPIYDAAGRAILAWARIEIELSLILAESAQGQQELAILAWDRFRNFESKIQFLNELVVKYLVGDEAKRDWILVLNEVRKCYKKRNMVAHAALLGNDRKGQWLEPFFSIAARPNEKEKRELFPADIIGFVVEFDVIRCCIQFIRFRQLNTETTHQQWPEQEPDLMLHLRQEDDRKREEQRRRALAFRRYQEQNLKLDDDPGS